MKIATDCQQVLEIAMSLSKQGLKKYSLNYNSYSLVMLLLPIKMCTKCQKYDFYNLEQP